MSKIPPSARFQNNRDGSVTLWFPYNPELVRRLKVIPGRYRRYHPEDGNSWQVWTPYVDTALRAFFDFHVSAPGYDEEPTRFTRPQEPQNGGEAFAVLHLLPTAPKVVIDAVYRVLAKTHHPDLGGDPAMMRRLTEAHETLSRRISA